MEKTFYISKQDFITVTAAWKASKTHDASDIIIYNLLRSMPADRGFVPKSKSIQGNDAWYAFNKALSYAQTRCNLKFAGKKAEYFKGKFGIDIPEDLHGKLCGALK